jgi:ADP-dependent NAD(P)H-hydrate dehydratase
MSVKPVTELPRLPRRPFDGHKGTFGTVLVVAGSCGLAGAATLAGRAALRSGAGLVRVACPHDIQNVVAASYPGYTTFAIRQHADGSFAEGSVAEISEFAKDASVVAIGPGLGRAPATVALVRQVLEALYEVPVVLDADGLFAVSPYTEEFKSRTAPLVLTPHPGEFARLTGEVAPKSESERAEQAGAFASRFRCVLLLKGVGTLVADGSRLYRNSTGNPGMATGGSGDVLTGVVAALVGMGIAAFDAAALGAWVHGRAGDLAASRLGETALTAVDLLDSLPPAFRELEADW